MARDAPDPENADAERQPIDPLAHFRLDDRTAVITGAAGGMGRDVALLFASVGAVVVLADRDEEALEASANRIRSARPHAHVVIVPTDVTSRSSVESLADRAVSAHGAIDVWVNLAGILRSSPIVETSDTELDDVISVNLKGVFFGIAAAGRAMAHQGHGSIVNVASAGGEMPIPGLGTYGMTKAAVMHLTRIAAVELGPSGVRVNAVAPGFTETPMVSVHWTDPSGQVDETARQRTVESRAAQSPLGRIGAPRDISEAMLYLATDASRFVTGQVVRPNGGIVMR
ncbi:MAG: dehydrogenase, short-chain alcohol dehydrogenase like [Actinomycetia bacterium]|nr:dehydrogenase, short-chain alcohol dehydrogenase like [Actinomycetes bacterium]